MYRCLCKSESCVFCRANIFRILYPLSDFSISGTIKFFCGEPTGKPLRIYLLNTLTALLYDLRPFICTYTPIKQFTPKRTSGNNFAKRFHGTRTSSLHTNALFMQSGWEWVVFIADEHGFIKSTLGILVWYYAELVEKVLHYSDQSPSRYLVVWGVRQ